MKFLLITIILMVIGNFITKNQKKELLKNQDKSEYTVRLPKIYAWVGITVTSLLLFLYLAVFVPPVDTVDFWINVSLCGFIILGGVLTNVALAWKIDVNINNEFFIYRTIFWRSLEIKYSDINEVGEIPFYLCIKYGKNTILIDKTAYNLELFNTILEQKSG